jgi:DNA-binding NtrC family response regulator
MTQTAQEAQPRVLVVDDDPAVRQLLVDYLMRHGFTCTTAGSGQDAMEALDGGHFDLVLMDVRMPGVDGITALREIKHQHPAQQVVMMTGSREVEPAVEAMRLGAEDYVMKPFAMREMLGKVSDAIHKGVAATEDASPAAIEGLGGLATDMALLARHFPGRDD